MNIKDYLILVSDKIEEASAKGDKEEVRRLVGVAMRALQDILDKL